MKKSAFRKLVEFSRKNGVNVKIFDDCKTHFLVSENTIFVNRKEYKGFEFIAALSHEIGHSMQTKVDNAYMKIDEECYTKKFVKARFTNEADAWTKSMNLLEKLNINIDISVYTNLVETALKTYYKL